MLSRLQAESPCRAAQTRINYCCPEPRLTSYFAQVWGCSGQRRNPVDPNWGQRKVNTTMTGSTDRKGSWLETRSKPTPERERERTVLPILSDPRHREKPFFKGLKTCNWLLRTFFFQSRHFWSSDLPQMLDDWPDGKKHLPLHLADPIWVAYPVETRWQGAGRSHSAEPAGHAGQARTIPGNGTARALCFKVHAPRDITLKTVNPGSKGSQAKEMLII